MKNTLVFVLIFTLFSCKKETYVQKELKKALNAYVTEESGDSLKVNNIQILRIDSISEYRELLRKIAVHKRAELDFVDSLKLTHNKVFAEMLIFHHKELNQLVDSLPFQHDTFRTATYNVGFSINYTYRNKTITDTSDIKFDRFFKRKRDFY